MTPTSLIPPEIRARLKELRLHTHYAAMGHGLGQHPSRSRGVGMEFAQYRPYEPGDEPRQIDWKLYARSDRFFVRESERDSPLSLWLVIDATASMAQADGDRSKLDAACSLAACAAELALRQGDAFGLVALSAEGLTLVPAGIGPRHRDRIFLELARLKPGGRFPREAQLRPVWERVGASSLVLILSDGFDDALVELAERLAAARRQVLSIQLLTAEERDFPFTGGHVFRDPETGAEREVEAGAVREDFLVRFAQARQALARRLGASGIGHVEYVLDRPLDEPLRRFFSVRGSEARSA